MEQLAKTKETMSQINRQTIKNRRKYDPKRSQAPFLRPEASKLGPGAETDLKKSSWGWILGPLWEAKWKQNR